MSDEIKEQVAEMNPEALFADGFEAALIGYGERFGQDPVALYDKTKVLAVLEADGASYDEAHEHWEYNVIGAWVGDGAPAFATLLPEDSSG